MNAPEELLSEVLSYLLNCESLREYKIVHAFPPCLKQSPLKKITLACCVEKSKFSHIQSDTKGDGVLSQSDILITVHIPPKNGGEESEEICGKLSRELFFSSPFDIKSLECGKISYRRETDSYIVPVTVSVEKFRNDGSGETSPDTPPTDAAVELGGEVIAHAKLCSVKAFRGGRLAAPEREDKAFGTVLGVLGYRLEFSKIKFSDDETDFYNFHDFTVTFNKKGKRIIYGGCEWLEIEENYSGEDHLIKKAVLISRSRVYEEGVG